MTRRVAGTIVIAALALAVVAIALALGAPAHSPRSPSVALRSQQLRMKNSKSGLPVVGATNIKPGARVRGAVRVRTSGADSNVALSATDLQDQPGPNGGYLTDDLRITVRWRTGSGPLQTQYQGPLTGLTERSLGTWPAGTTRHYVIIVRFPQRPVRPNPGGDNRYQGSTASFGLVWTATGL